MALNDARRLPLKTGFAILAANESNSSYIWTEYSQHARGKLDEADEILHVIAQKKLGSHTSDFPINIFFFF